MLLQFFWGKVFSLIIQIIKTSKLRTRTKLSTAQWVTRFRQSRGNCFKSNCKPCYSFKFTLLTQTRNRQISISENEFIISVIIHDARFLFCCIRYLLLLICFLQLQDKSKRASLKKGSHFSASSIESWITRLLLLTKS